jgi:hypothetical protein
LASFPRAICFNYVIENDRSGSHGHRHVYLAGFGVERLGHQAPRPPSWAAGSAGCSTRSGSGSTHVPGDRPRKKTVLIERLPKAAVRVVTAAIGEQPRDG